MRGYSPEYEKQHDRKHRLGMSQNYIYLGLDVSVNSGHKWIMFHITTTMSKSVLETKFTFHTSR